MKRLLVALGALWCLTLFLERGDCDANEHAHVAWLMGTQGLRPLEGFFQHHMPLLWDVLKVYFLVGGEGPEVLYFGHALVVLSVLALLFAGWSLARLWAGERADCAVSLGLCSLVGLYLMDTHTFQLRPDCLAVGAWALALLAWCRQRYLWSGFLFCAANCFSPRFVLLLGWLALGTRRDGRAAVLWLSGAALFLLAYVPLSGASPRYFHFALVSSALLQRLGDFDPLAYLVYRPIVKIALLQTLLLLGLWRLLPERRAWWPHLAYLLFTVAAGAAMSWPHIYLHNFIPSYLSLALSLIYLGSRAHWTLAARRAAMAALAGLCLGLGVEIATTVQRHWTIVEDIRFRRQILSLLGPADTVLLSPPLHPIAVRDASYYGSWVGDDPRRTAETAARLRHAFGLPAFDHLEVLRDRPPHLVDQDLPRVAGPAAKAETQAILSSRYEPVPWSSAYDPRTLLYRRR